MEKQRGRVLVVDDDVLLGKMLKRALDPEHDVLVVASGREALDLIASGERFDLILCDLMLPGVTGIDVYEGIGSIAPELVNRVVFLTGGAFSARSKAFLEQDTIAWIEKPLPSVAEFREVVRQHILRARTGQRPECAQSCS